jgi:hypothetical protein
MHAPPVANLPQILGRKVKKNKENGGENDEERMKIDMKN